AGDKSRRAPGTLRTREPAEGSHNYMAAITLLRTAEILVLRRPRVTTTAMVMTPSTTAYSAIVWPDSSLRSANRRLRYSIKEFTSPHPVSRSRRGRRILFDLFRQMPWSLEGLLAISPVWGNCRQRRISLTDRRSAVRLVSPVGMLCAPENSLWC